MYFEFINDFDIVLQPYGSFISSKSVNNFHVLNESATKIILEMMSGRSLKYVSDGCEKQTDYLTNLLSSHNYGQTTFNKTVFSGTMDLSRDILKATRAEVEITNKCNLNCLYCYAQVNTSKYEISADQWLDIFDGMYENGLRTLLISGGEPFIRSDLLDILENVTKKFIVEINTNGRYITDEVAQKLSLMNLKRIQISLDSINSEYHDNLRGAGSHAFAINAIKVLSKYKVPIQISMVTTSKNESNIPEMASFANDIGAEFQLNKIIKAGNAKKISDNEWSKNFKTKDSKNTKLLNTFHEMSFTPVCQSQMGYVAISHSGILKPCNMREDFFEPTKEQLLVDFKNKWWNKPYAFIQLGKYVQNVKDPTLDDIEKIKKMQNKPNLCNLQIALLLK